MEQHPVPQQISSYEFRLVGDMTLKQFAQVAAGCLIALLFYASPLPVFLKWPFLLFAAFGGAALAFLPFEERPLQTWVWAFLRAVYSPTQFIWQKRGQKPAVFEEKTTIPVHQVAPVGPTDEAKNLADYLLAFSSAQVVTEEEEQKFLDRIHQLFSSVTTSQVYQQTPSHAPYQRQPEPEEKVEPAKPTQAEQPSSPIPWRIETAPGLQSIPKYNPPLPIGFMRHRQRQQEQALAARFSPQVPMPSIPTLPNVLVGMVVDQAGKIVEGAIVEIRDSQGNPVRAFRTNKLGQFRIVTPLPDDIYEIEIEREGFKFDLLKIGLTGEIIKPMEIRAKEEKSEALNPKY